jgi:predicted CoA-binding protein
MTEALLSSVERRVAVIGASNDRRKYGNKAVRAFRAQGYVVYPINPHEVAVEGVTAYPTITDVPGPVEMATMYVPPEIGMTVIDDLARKGVKEVWFNPGSESPALLARAAALGLQAIEACSISGIGDTPGKY